jgi:hypothetical protein
LQTIQSKRGGNGGDRHEEALAVWRWKEKTGSTRGVNEKANCDAKPRPCASFERRTHRINLI